MDVISKYIAAAIQYEPTLGQKNSNIADLKELIKTAAQKAKLIVVPEMATTGYCFQNREEITPYMETIPGPTTEIFAQIAHSNSCYIVLSLPEECDNGNYYNACVLIGPRGIVGKYRKTHLYETDTKWANVGNLGFPIFSTEIGRIGCMICNDYFFFEPARIMALKGVEVLCNSSNWGVEKCPAPSWFSRAWENSVYLISANRWGNERGMQCSGGSSIITPDGQLSDYIDRGDGIVYGEINIASNKHDVQYPCLNRLNDRKPIFYHNLSLSTYLYDSLYRLRLYQDQVLPDGKESAVAIYQFHPNPLRIEDNIKKVEAAMLYASANKVELLVLPELAMSGNLFSKEEAQKAAEPIPGGMLFQKIVDMAHKHQIQTVLSMAELCDNAYHNTVVLVDGNGLREKYQKIHLNRIERSWASAGSGGFKWVDLEQGRVGLLAGDDCIFPESTMCLAASGVDIITIPSALHEPQPVALKETALSLPPTAFIGGDPIHWHLWRNRSVETNTYIAFANQINDGGMGYSGIFGPTDWPRREKVIGKNEGLITCKINTGKAGVLYPNTLVRTKDNMRMRVPYFYDPLVHKTKG